MIRKQGKFTTKGHKKGLEKHIKEKETNMDNTNEHDCNDNVCTNCDGEFHHSFCTVCGKDMGVTNCDDK